MKVRDILKSKGTALYTVPPTELLSNCVVTMAGEDIGAGGRYLPVLDGTTLAGVVSFHDVARSVYEEQSFENSMLKAYIRDWPAAQAA